MKPELLVNEHCGCGENPLWDEQRGWLYWCDISGSKIFALDPSTNKHHLVWHGNEECGAFTIQEDGTLLLLLTGRAMKLDPMTGETTLLFENIVSNTGRFNDCIPDPNGRVFSGTVDWEQHTRGALFSLDFDGTATKICEGTACSNGMGFTPDLTALYWSDSTAKTVYLFDYNRQTSQLSNRREWVKTPGITPDGLTVDAQGDVWVAFFDGGCLHRYTPTGQLREEIKFPVKNVTSCIFGGKNMDELFVTTAGGKPNSRSLDGALFRLKPNVQGQQRFRSKIGI